MSGGQSSKSIPSSNRVVATLQQVVDEQVKGEIIL